MAASSQSSNNIRHPLQLLTDQEIRAASATLLRYVSDSGKQQAKVHFKNISLHDPPKALLLPYLDAEAAGLPHEKRGYVPRCVDVIWSTENGRYVTESVVSLDAKTVIAEDHMGRGQHGPNDRYEVRQASQVILSDPKVLEAIKALKLPSDVVIACDPWMYGADKDSTEDTPKYIQALLYARAPHNHPDSNQYAYPLPFSPRYNIHTDQVVAIDPLATGGEENGLAYHTAPADTPMAHLQPNEYYPDLLDEELRQDVKPLHVVQPEGPSFEVKEGNQVCWQKYKFRIGFNYREGTTIHDVRYDGRPLFYRLSVSEMTVPYGDPRSPYHRKQAFDLGDAGAGSCANNLALGCDCLGAIKYFGGWLSDDKGEPVPAENVICLHEQDGGINFKHTNHRTGNPAITRARNLVVQSIITVGNYEYIFAWVFMQNGNIELETRATGILSTQLIDDGKTSPWGTVVSRGVLAANHQHLFSLRIDPMIDGPSNTVIQEESIAVPHTEDENPHGNAWRVVKTPLATSGPADAAPFANRAFKIVNEGKKNPVSGNPVGYKLVPQPCQLILASPTSVAHARAQFAKHHLWVTKYRDGDLWAGGKWTNQSLCEVNGVADMAARNENVRNEDLVVWLTFGMTHNPRVEDFPIMPSEITTISLKPADFFRKNPALDVPQSEQKRNKSVLVQDPWPGAEKRADGADAKGCCGKAKL
ncbi:uncharacterized protein LTR77_006341 [Saxophila tyrrhenica]|uniref:Amine oxidase n=1 Tax=Saxophila tyrrhenica TaxID=1690608 RepID=A0AAV9P881_9PEZI|nr:hypothetical protein LTR77_006341 [Saxophila tyrrhenica]